MLSEVDRDGRWRVVAGLRTWLPILERRASSEAMVTGHRRTGLPRVYTAIDSILSTLAPLLIETDSAQHILQSLYPLLFKVFTRDRDKADKHLYRKPNTALHSPSLASNIHDP